jgi:D,D-heptose 1,7-bisphosphate phosphatase
MIKKAVILAGGKGSRLGNIVEKTPKPMLDVSGKPFIYYLIRQLSSYSFEEINILTGYKSHVFEKYINNFKFQNMKINLIKEESPLGTGGALKNFFQTCTENEKFIVLNGDAFIDINFTEVINNKSNYGINIIGIDIPDNKKRYGQIIYKKDKVIQFKEKTKETESKVINSGIYIFNDISLINSHEEDIFSLEHSFFPKLVKQNKLGINVLENNFFLDIGLPETYLFAQTHLNKRKKCLFLDRDNTINVDKGYTYKTSDLKFTPQIINIIKRAKELGFLIIVITNQSGIGRGLYEEKDLWNFHYNIQSKLFDLNLNIDALYFCPHSPISKKTCKCRKPKTGLMDDIIRDWNIDLKNSIFVGDSEVDEEFTKKSKISNFKYIQEIVEKHDIQDLFNF